MIELINLYKKESETVFNQLDSETINDFVDIIIRAYDEERKIFVCANGGSVSGVENFVIDINMHPFVSEDKSIKSKLARNKFAAISLCNSGGTLTGITNDLGFENIYSEQLNFMANSGDVLLGISGSGTSRNIVKAIEKSKEIGMQTILFTRHLNPPCVKDLDLLFPIKGNSNFPGQTGKNNNNFHFEDIFIKLTHISVGLLKLHIQGC